MFLPIYANLIGNGHSSKNRASRTVCKAYSVANSVRRPQLLDPYQLLARLVFHDVPCYCAGGDSQWTCQIHLSGAAAAGKVTVLCADDDLIRTRGDARSGVDAGAATRLNHVR